MSDDDRADGLVYAYQLDGRGGGRTLTWAEIARPRPRGSTTWVHLDRSAEATRTWIREQSGLTPLACEALLADETRPRVDRLPDGLIVVFRGVNLNPGANPEDMVSLRLWVDEHRLISVRHRRLMAVQDVRDRLAAGDFPRGTGSLLAAIGAQLAWRMEPVIAELSERVDELEGEVITSAAGELRAKLAALRREIIGIRRYLAPQRDAMLRLQAETVRWLGDQDRFEIREAADRTTRYLEELDAARERLGVAHEELISRLSEQLNQRMYLLAIIAAIFLPLSLLTGLLGINVGGMPGATSDAAFAVVSVLLVVIGIGLALVLRRLRFF